MPCEMWDEHRGWLSAEGGEQTSKHEIIIPHAGAILAMRGNIPANRVAGPSVRNIRSNSVVVDVIFAVDGDMRRAWRLVLRTSNGDVARAAVVPLMEPLMKATHAPENPCWRNIFLQLS
jgi:hypothetical protein